MNPFLDQPNPFLEPDAALIRASVLRRKEPLSDVYRALAEELHHQGMQKLQAPVDPSAHIDLMRRNQVGAQRKLAIALAAIEAGKEYHGLGGQYLQKSLALREPVKVGGAGIVDPTGLYVEDPTFANQQRANALLQQAQRYDQLAQRAANAEERAAAMQASAEAKAEAQRMAAETRQAMLAIQQGNLALRQSQIELQNQQIRERLDAAAQKRADDAAKKEAKLAAAETQAATVMDAIQKAKGLVSPHSAGFGGLLAVIPTTKARDLAAHLTTIKANLGFDRLKQMREESPTGGALGQVAIQELVALQAVVASLDQMQSPSQLQQALDKIEVHYHNWLETMRKANRVGDSAQAVPAGAVRPGGASPVQPAPPLAEPPPGAVRPRSAR